MHGKIWVLQHANFHNLNKQMWLKAHTHYLQMKTLMAVVDPRYAVAAVLTVDIAPGEYGVAVHRQMKHVGLQATGCRLSTAVCTRLYCCVMF